MSSRPEPEWDETEVGWFLALEEYRTDLICPSCGWPKAICQDPATELAAEVPPPTRCHISTALDRAQKAYADGVGANPAGLLWGARLRPSADARDRPLDQSGAHEHHAAE